MTLFLIIIISFDCNVLRDVCQQRSEIRIPMETPEGCAKAVGSMNQSENSTLEVTERYCEWRR